MTDEEVLAVVREAFAMARPERFTDHPGCEECAEHDETLQQHTLESLSNAEIGSAAWNPITMCTPEAFAYWMPALARLCLGPEDAYFGWSGELLFMSHLRRDGPRNERWAYCSREQRDAVAAFIEHVINTRSELIERYGLADEVLEVLTIWSERGQEE